jgi:pimeloyl-ACP methyl ester carboxylesterase
LKIKKYVVEVSNNTMTDTRPAFVFVHGAWNSAAAWHKFIPLLEARGYVARALDLPGAGARANAPSSYDRRPLDAVAFASEPSPNASVTQEDRARAVIALVEDTRRQTGAPIVLVGHSLGGLTVTAVAETIPEQLHAVVYLCAYMAPPGMSTNTIIQDPSMSGSLVRALIKANPKEVGAIRIDWRSEDSEYREQLRLAFAGDVSPTDFCHSAHPQALRRAGPTFPHAIGDDGGAFWPGAPTLLPHSRGPDDPDRSAGLHDFLR